LDELINGSTNNLNDIITLNEYKDIYITYDKLGLSYDKNKTDQVVKAYCNGMTSCHNRQYKENWSPAIMIHTDVLAFYMVISDFRGLIHKLRSPTSFDIHM
jgi:hypothetical protein